ncbi:sensor histidine kinase [Rasiella sp. SM2506]|uniref:sensor histidine kinase n=1 Tax=Rasiella sp. SM2506 TaxID=3423914 RepID=UPI003D7B0ECD
MIPPIIPHNEQNRLAALRSYGISYTHKEEEYDQITNLATHISEMPISLISFVEENDVWFKSTQGMDICSGDRNVSFCSYAVGEDHPVFVVNDTKKDDTFKNHPYAKLAENPIAFYAGICLVDKDGYKLGTLCVIDNKPNKLSEKQVEGLKKLARQTVKLIELHSANHILRNIHIDLEAKNNELKNFAGVVSHDMKMPLANIILTTDILKAKYASQLDEKAIGYLTYLKQSSFTLSDYITGLLNHYESDKLAEEGKENFDSQQLLEEIIELLNINMNCDINLPENNLELYGNRAALEQIFMNLIGNSLKYNDKEKIVIDIEAEEMTDSYFFKVSDNGMGIPKDKQAKLFDLFSTVGTMDRNGQKGSGIGLSTVKKLITNLGGIITVVSRPNIGTSFEFSLKK